MNKMLVAVQETLAQWVCLRRGHAWPANRASIRAAGARAFDGPPIIQPADWQNMSVVRTTEGIFLTTAPVCHCRRCGYAEVA